MRFVLVIAFVACAPLVARAQPVTVDRGDLLTLLHLAQHAPIEFSQAPMAAAMMDRLQHALVPPPPPAKPAKPAPKK